jgi:hypothetical protein
VPDFNAQVYGEKFDGVASDAENWWVKVCPKMPPE